MPDHDNYPPIYGKKLLQSVRVLSSPHSPPHLFIAVLKDWVWSL